MATLETLVLQLQADNQKLLAKIDETTKQVQGGFNKMQGSVEQFSIQSQGYMSRLSRVFDIFAGTVLANLATAVVQYVTRPFADFFANLGEGIQAAAEMEKQTLRLANSLAQAGNYSREAQKDLLDFAETLSKSIAVGGEVIVQNLALLSSLTRLDSEGLKRAQMAAADLAAELGIDLNAATNLVAKAVNGNVAPLQRYGIELENTGNRARDGARALDQLEKRVGGSAIAAQKTYEAALRGTQEAFGDVFEQMGKVATSSAIVIDTLKALTRGFETLSAFIASNADTIEAIFGRVFILATRILQGFVQALDAVGRTFRAVYTLMTELSFDKAVKSLSDDSALLSFSQGLFDLANNADLYLTTMQGLNKEIGPNLKNQEDQVKKLTAAEEERRARLQSFAKELLESANSISNTYSMQSDVLKTQYDADLINFEIYKQGKLAAEAEYMEQQRLMLEQARQAGVLAEENYTLAIGELNRQQALQRMKTQEELRKAEEASQQKRLQAVSGFFGNLSALQNTGSKELFAIGKASAMAQATIDGFAAVQAAYRAGSAFGPGVAAAFAAAAGAATAINVAKIASTGLRRGIDSVPGVGTQDSFPAMLAPGERVVPTKTNEDLTAFLQRMDDRQMDQQVVFNLNFNGPVWADKASAGSEIIEAINEAIDRGMGLRLRNA